MYYATCTSDSNPLYKSVTNVLKVDLFAVCIE